MTQHLHLVFEEDENKNRHLIHAGLDENSVKSATRRERKPESVQLYVALDVDRLQSLMRETEGLVANSVVMSNKGETTTD